MSISFVNSIGEFFYDKTDRTNAYVKNTNDLVENIFKDQNKSFRLKDEVDISNEAIESNAANYIIIDRLNELSDQGKADQTLQDYLKDKSFSGQTILCHNVGFGGNTVNIVGDVVVLDTAYCGVKNFIVNTQELLISRNFTLSDYINKINLIADQLILEEGVDHHQLDLSKILDHNGKQASIHRISSKDMQKLVKTMIG